MKMKTLRGDDAVVKRNVHRIYDWSAIGLLVVEVKETGNSVGFTFTEMKAGQQQGFTSAFRERFEGRGARLASMRLNPSSDTGYQFQIILEE